MSILSSLTLIIISACGTTTAMTGQQIADAGSGALQTTASIMPTEEQLYSESVMHYAIPGDVVEVMPVGEIDWSGNAIRATGTGVLDVNNPSIAQARLMAERAAVVVAQRNLLETIQGVCVDSETRVENFMTDYDVIYTSVEGIVRDARQIGPARYDSLAGIVEVELEMEIHSPQGLSGALSSVLGTQELNTAAMSPATRDFLEQYSALVLDGTQAGLQPSMYPKIYDSNGNLLLDTSAYSSYLGSAGQTAMQFISDIDLLLSHPHFAQSPLVVNVRQVTGQFGTDIVLGETESSALGWLREGLPFLMTAGRFLLDVL